jgi:hypothetical protein
MSLPRRAESSRGRAREDSRHRSTSPPPALEDALIRIASELDENGLLQAAIAAAGLGPTRARGLADEAKAVVNAGHDAGRAIEELAALAARRERAVTEMWPAGPPGDGHTEMACPRVFAAQQVELDFLRAAVAAVRGMLLAAEQLERERRQPGE